MTNGSVTYPMASLLTAMREDPYLPAPSEIELYDETDAFLSRMARLMNQAFEMGLQMGVEGWRQAPFRGGDETC